jgi:hypothetical protein
MATPLDQIVPVSIKIGAIVPSQVAFATPMIAAQFLPAKTTVTFTRSRIYTSLAAMIADGWNTFDSVYLYAQSMLSQNPNVQSFVVGRRDSGDPDWPTALTAIQAENPNWYAFVAVPNATTVSASITEQLQIAGWAETATRPFFTDSADPAILAAGSGDAATQIAALTRNYTVVTYHVPAIATASSTVTGGASQAVATVSTPSIGVGVVNLSFGAAFITGNTVAGTINGQAYSVLYNTSDAQTFLNLVAAIQALTGTQASAVNPAGATYANRSINIGSAPAGAPASGESISAAWLGYVLTLPLGSWNPTYRNLSGVTPDALTMGQKLYAWGKLASTFTTVAGLNFTERGWVAGGTYKYFDITMGVDWLHTNIQTEILQLLAGNTKVPFTDAGGALLQATVAGVLQTAAANGIVDPTSIVVTVPKVANISSTDKANRNFPNVSFLARVQGAVNTVVINGTVSF